MNARISLSLLIFAAVLVSTWFALKPQAAGSAPGASIPTFSTAEIGRQGHFYVGGHYVGEPGNETMHGAMYVEVWVPRNIRHPYPIVFVTGGGGQGAYALKQTPDGRPGWAYDFVNQGYTVYIMDYPGNGRSAFSTGGATGSAAMMPLTNFGRASATSQPVAAIPEWNSRMTGWPMLSSNWTMASTVTFSGTAARWSSVLAK